VSYNIEGLSCLYDPEMRSYLAAFDFCLLVETFATTFPTLLFPNHDVFLSPAVRLTDAVTARLSGGVALLVRKEFRKYIEKIQLEYDNMVVLKLSKDVLGTDTSVILLGTYLPPITSNYYAETELQNGVALLEQCILDLIELYGDVPLILIGDLNARTGCENSHDSDLVDCALNIFDDNEQANNNTKRLSKDVVLNDFGRYLLNVCNAFGLKILNGTFNDKNSNNFTYVSPTGCSVVDYFIVSRALSCLFSMTVGERIECKHMPIELVAHVQAKPGRCSVFDRKVYKIEKYAWDREKSEQFMNLLSSDVVQGLLVEATDLIDTDINYSLVKFQQVLLTAGTCMKKSITVGKQRAQAWFDKECRVNRMLLRQKLRHFIRSGTVEDRLQYNNKRKEYKELLRIKKSNYRKHVIDSLNANKNNATLFWRKLKTLLSKKNEGNTVSTEEWYDHFSKLFNEGQSNENRLPDLSNGNDADPDLHQENDTADENIDIDCLECDISESEVYEAIRALKNGKAAGPDGILSEFFKHAATTLVPYLVKCFNRLFSTGSYPTNWTESIIQPIHKKGDLNNPDNYRGISLLNISSKLYSYILNRRLSKWLEDQNVIDESQAGFRKSYSTVDHVFVITALIQKQLSYHRKLYVAFIDFRKAFDSVVRTKLWAVLRKNGINGKMYRAITSIYDIVKAKVRSGGELTNSFMCPLGLKQGEVCSPVLFSLFINELARDIISNGRHGIQLIPEFVEILILMFADDVILMSDTVCGLQNQLNVLYETARRLGLAVNLDKSNIVVFRNGGHIAAYEKWMYDTEVMKIVNAYKYLGIYLSTRLSFSHSLNDMAGRAKKGIIGILKLLWSLGDKSPTLFFKLFDVQIQPMLNYGAEIWGLDADLKIIEKVQLFALKRFLNVSSRTPNVLVYGETGRYPLYINVYMKCIKYWLKILQMPAHRLPYKAYKMLVFLHEQNRKTWATSVCYTLYKYGFDDVWLNQGVGDVKKFLAAFKERLILEYSQEWSEILTGNERYTLYSTYKSTLSISSILCELRHVQARNCLIRVRLGVSQLNTHRLRFARNVNETDLSCPFCKDTVESEIHFILVCPKYADIRVKYLPKKFFNCPSMFKLSMLFATENKSLMLRFSKYLLEAFQLRENTRML
jgi:hypothetical protein